MSCRTLCPPPIPDDARLVHELSQITCFEPEDVADALRELPILDRPTDLIELGWHILDVIDSWSWTIAGGASSDA